MMKYRDETGSTFEGSTYAEIVDQLASLKLTEPKTRQSYRDGVARRVSEVSGLQLETSSDKVFLKSLVELGFLERVD